MSDWICGRRAVAEYLKDVPGCCLRLLVLKGLQVPPDIAASSGALGIPVEVADRGKLDRAAKGEIHQNVCLEVGGWTHSSTHGSQSGWELARYGVSREWWHPIQGRFGFEGSSATRANRCARSRKKSWRVTTAWTRPWVAIGTIRTRWCRKISASWVSEQSSSTRT